MTSSIERILADIVEQLNEAGYTVSGRLGEEWLLSWHDNFPAMLFDVIDDNPNIEDYSQDIKFMFVLCYASEEFDEIVEVQKFEELRQIYIAFFNKLKNYENKQGQQLIDIRRATRKPYYFDIKFLEQKTKGLRCEMDINIQATTRC